jgi:hypothetical protein
MEAFTIQKVRYPLDNAALQSLFLERLQTLKPSFKTLRQYKCSLQERAEVEVRGSHVPQLRPPSFRPLALYCPLPKRPNSGTHARRSQ